MVRIEEEGEHDFQSIVNFLEKGLEGADSYVMETQEITKGKTHEYDIADDWTVRVKGHYLHIISEHTDHVIDLSKEVPYHITSKGISEKTKEDYFKEMKLTYSERLLIEDYLKWIDNK